MIPFKIGDILEYRNNSSTWNGAVCEVVDVGDGQFQVRILKVGNNGRKFWASGKINGDFFEKDLWKFYLVSEQKKELTKEERVIAKIKYLEDKWKRQQLSKGNKYYEMPSM